MKRKLSIIIIGLALGALLTGAGILVRNDYRMSHGDINHDGTVNLLDFSILAHHYSGAKPLEGDLNGDGKVNALDLSIMAKNWTR